MKPQVEFDEAIGRRLVEIRKELGLNQQDLADCIGLSRPSMVNVEKGRRGLQLWEALKLAELLNCTVKEIMGED